MRLAAAAIAWLSTAALYGSFVLLSASTPVGAEETAEYYAVCDAGSTGTRLYIFSLGGASKASSVFVKKVKPGLSSYAANPAGTVEPLLKLFTEGAQKVPEEKRGAVPLFILGTAGMRLLPPEKQRAIWGALGAGLEAAPTFPFSKSSLVMRTVSGVEEGLWAVVTANFLTDRISTDLKIAKENPAVGLLDLGGSSTQIAIPPLAQGGSAHIGEGATVQSYLGFGMTRLREEVRRKTSNGADAACYMKGYALDENGQQLTGTGDAPLCRVLIEAIMQSESESCNANRPADEEASCLGDLSKKASEVKAVSSGSLDFFAVSGFTYAADFVRWWFELPPNKGLGGAFSKAFPQPTLTEMAAAVDAMCAGDWSTVESAANNEETKHPFTGPDNTAFRCFQANYILVLLGKVYGFPQGGRGITFALDVAGEDLEWPLGALLHEQEKKAGKKRSEL
mmetsp:Transcript_43996/g.113731  ORF Transcript_43996/g.113731 Transcript_43996/m.113731 type:complete len:451 (-) Transcript_43996:101-1453(-)